jgi:hypothetical protein
MRVRRFEEGDRARIERFNARLRAGGAAWEVYPEGPTDSSSEEPVRSRLFVAEVDDEVRGAVWLREHEFWIDGRVVRAGWAKYPVSESLVDARHGGVAGALIIKLMREQPLLMSLGMGGHGGAFARLLSSMRWATDDVPFFVSIVRPARVLRHLKHLRRTRARRVALDLLAYSGLGWAGWTALSGIRSLATGRRPAPLEIDVVPGFGSWADDLWQDLRGAYGFTARRDVAMLDAVYPASMPVERLRLRRSGRDIGWATVLRRDLSAVRETPFGPLRIGMLADTFARPEDALAVTAAATAYLRSHDLDLLISNQRHTAWVAALAGNGFLRAPTQFAFYRSPAMAKLLAAAATPLDLHVNRGDCDGPVFA